MNSVKHAFQVDQTATVDFKGSIFSGKIIGVDDYDMQNFLGQSTYWPSYTLISEDEAPFDRFWFADWGKDGWILWLTIKEMPALASPYLKRSGVATISFTGDAGYSAPFAALSMFYKDDVVYCAERFRDGNAMFFAGHKIAKPQIT